MIPEQASQKRSVVPAAAPAQHPIITCSVPPKKRPRLPDTPDCSVAAVAPLDLSAKSMTPAMPGIVGSFDSAAAELLIQQAVPAMQDSQQWQAAAAAAAAAMYAQYMTTYLNSLMPLSQPQQQLQQPVLPPQSLMSPQSGDGRAQLCSSFGETDFRCSCGRHFLNLVGLTVHMQKAGHAAANTSVYKGGVSEFSTASAAAAESSVRELPKLVRGQDMWINSETEQTREILRCIRCRQSYRTLPELTMHMVRSRHYAEIINSSSSTPTAPSTSTPPRLSQTKPQTQPPQKLQQHRDHDQPAYLCPDLQPSQCQTARGGDSNPLSCLQRLVDRAADVSDSAVRCTAAAAAAPATSPSAASTSSTSEAASMTAVTSCCTEDHDVQQVDDAAHAVTPSPPTLPARKQQQQQQQQQQQPQFQKKTKCQFCARPFANKGQVRLHVSKGKCPGGRQQRQQQQQQPLPQPQAGLSLFEYFFSAGAAARANPVWW